MRLIKNLLTLVIIVAVLAGGGVVALRIARGRPSGAETIKPNLVGVTAAGVYLFAARTGAHVVVFDTGADPEGRPVDAALSALGAGRGDVSHVFITHAHADHLGGAAGLAAARIHVGAGDVDVAEKKSEPGALVPKLVGKALSVPAVTVSDPLAGAAAIDVGDGKTVKAIPAPGHTPGSYVFLYDGVLFAGDTMMFKQGRLDPPPKFFDADSATARASLASLKQQIGDAEMDTICTAHGGCTPSGLGKNLLDDLVGRLGS